MPYYVGILPSGAVESLKVTLDPTEAQSRYVKAEIVLNPMNAPTYKNEVGFREFTADELISIIAEKARVSALEQNVFTKLQIRRALREIDQESILDGLLDGNPTFKSDWSDAQEIDLSDTMTAQALASVSVDIDQIKLKIVGIE